MSKPDDFVEHPEPTKEEEQEYRKSLVLKQFKLTLAQEWQNKYPYLLLDYGVVQEIQLEAIRYGMWLALEIAAKYSPAKNTPNSSPISEIILTAAKDFTL